MELSHIIQDRSHDLFRRTLHKCVFCNTQCKLLALLHTNKRRLNVPKKFNALIFWRWNHIFIVLHLYFDTLLSSVVAITYLGLYPSVLSFGVAVTV